MRKGWVVFIVVVLLLVGAGGGVWFGWARPALAAQAEAQERSARERAAETSQSAAYDCYARLMNRMDQLAELPVLTLTEGNELVGSYSMDDLGLREVTEEALCAQFNETEQMNPAAFTALSYEQKMAVVCEVKTPQTALAVESLNLEAVFADLDAKERHAATDAYARLEDGGYRVVPEQPGTELRRETVVTVLAEALKTVTVDTERVHGVNVELTDYDCYLPPEQTVETALFDYAAQLDTDLTGVAVTVNFQGSEETLLTAEYVGVNAEGVLQIEEARLAAQVEQWAEQYDRVGTPYLLNTYVEGPVPMRFLPVDYQLDTEALTAQLVEQMRMAQSAVIDAPFLCLRNGEPFSLGDTYVEVDIKNQVMTYFKEGDVLVTTDIVSGSAWLSPTPEGLYQVDNMTTDAWLYGEDYTVFVEYWVGFIGFWYGLHDASWRTDFGGDNYRTNGSHGCINTPTEAITQIYNNIELGTPVIVHGPYRD